MTSPDPSQPRFLESREPWTILHTLSRQEKVVSDLLTRQGVVNYLPLIETLKMHRGRKAQVLVPVIPGYVFLRGPREAAYDVDRAGRVAAIIKVIAQDQLTTELRNLHMALSLSAPLLPHHHIKKGMRVRVREGPFRDLEGIVEDRNKLDRIVLQVDILGQARSMEIDGAFLDVVE